MATLIFISGRGSVISNVQEWKSGSIHWLSVYNVAWAAQVCVHFMKVLSVNALNPHLLTLNTIVCFLSSIEILWSLLNKQCRSRADCSSGPILSWRLIMKWFLRSFSSLPLIHSRRVVVSYKRKYVHELLVNRLFKPAQEKVWLGELAVPQWP